VLRSVFPARVVVSLVVAFAFVGLVVAAGTLFRDRHAAGPHRPVAPQVSSPRTTVTSG
jgi:hypothetical protein